MVYKHVKAKKYLLLLFTGGKLLLIQVGRLNQNLTDHNMIFVETAAVEHSCKTLGKS